MARQSSLLQPTDAVTAILAALAHVPLVALGEAHCLQEEADFIVALLHHPAVPTTVQDIVVEYGNARYQPLIDRFIAGELVPNPQLRAVWRDCVGNFGLADVPIHEQFFRTVRAINRSLPAAQRLRVLLGDPPVDWRAVQRHADVAPLLEQRDAHFAAVVEHEVLRKGRRALLIAGSGHFARVSEFPPSTGTVTQRIEQRYPGSLFLVVPHVAHGQRPREFAVIEAQLTSWPIPSLAQVHGTWLGDLDARVYFSEEAKMIGEDGTPMPIRIHYIDHAGRSIERVTLTDMIDALLYLGPSDTLTRSHPNPAIYRGDAGYLAELQRRRGLVFGQPLDTQLLFAECEPQYGYLGEGQEPWGNENS